MITPTTAFDDCAFLDDSDDDMNETITKLDHFIDSDDDEKVVQEDVEQVASESSEEEPEPVPVKPKKKVRKAKKPA